VAAATAAGKSNYTHICHYLPLSATIFYLPLPVFYTVDNIRLLFAYTVLVNRYDRPSHQVYMYFQSRGGWQVQFLEVDLKTPLPRQFTFQHADKLRELARRGEALGTLEQKQALEHGIEMGRGGLYLRL
jgi:hypothetical protein